VRCQLYSKHGERRRGNDWFRRPRYLFCPCCICSNADNMEEPMNYQSYPTKKSVPSRRNRKGTRNKTFIYNATLRGKLNREKRATKEEANG